MSDPTNKTAVLTMDPVTPEATQAIVYKDRQTPERLQEAKEIAQREYPRMISNSLVYANFGNDAVAAVNALVDRLLDTVSNDELRAFDPVIKELSKQLDAIAHKYDVSDPKVAAKYSETKAGWLGFWRGAGAFWRMLKRDIKSVRRLLEDAQDDLQKRRSLLEQSVGNYDVLYDQNRQDIRKLIFVIVVMELMRDMAIDEAKNMVITDDAFGDGGDEERGIRRDLANNLDMRINDFKSRLFFAQRGAPNTRLVRSVDLASIGKNDAMTNHAVPLIKNFMFEMAMLQRGRDAAEVALKVRNTLNTMIQQYAGSASVIIPEITRINNTTLLAAESVQAVVAGFKATVNGMIKETEVGLAERRKVAALMEAGSEEMKQDSIHFSDRTLELLEAANKPNPETIAVFGASKLGVTA